VKKKLYDIPIELGGSSWVMRDHSFPSQRNGQIPFLPEEFIKLVCGDNGGDYSEEFSWAGRLITEIIKDEEMIMPDTHFLDVGCGCGRVARYLLAFPIKSYTGFDRHHKSDSSLCQSLP